MNNARELIHECRFDATSAQRTTNERNSHLRSQVIAFVVCVLLVPVDVRAEGLVPTTATSADRFMPVWTFTELLGQNHAAVIARRSDSSGSDLISQKNTKFSSFEISDVLKGEPSLSGSTVDARTFGDDLKGEMFLLVGKRSKSSNEISWRVASSVTQAYREHVLTVNGLEQSGAQRLTFFQALLEHADQSVSANAHLEFVVAADDAFERACDQLDRTNIRQWLSEPDIAADRRRLYLAMLARCGNVADAEWIQQELTARDVPASLDIWLGCYLALKGEAGLPLLHSRYLVDPQATFAETYAAIQALRFVRDLPSSPLSRESLILSFRLLLENNALADLVIPDLARLKDWESMDRLAALFKEPDAELCRVPVVNFIRACPTAIAKERLTELEILDPNAVRRAKSFFGVADLSKTRVTLRRLYGVKGISGC